MGRERMYECRAKINIGLSQTKSNSATLDTPESLDWTDKDSLLENLKRWENDEDCTPERGGEQMFRDVEFLPEMLKSDKAVYELLGVTFEEVVVYSTTAGCWV